MPGLSDLRVPRAHSGEQSWVSNSLRKRSMEEIQDTEEEKFESGGS
jgi:hypothetical protein